MSDLGGTMAPTGGVTAKLIRGENSSRLLMIKKSIEKFCKRLYYISALFDGRLLVAEAQLEAVLIRSDGTTRDYGIVSRKKVTNAFVAFIVAQLVTDTSEVGDFKYHDSGVGTTAEANTDTAMETTDGESRATGTQVAGGSLGVRTYQSVGTISYTTTKAITEHGLFSSASSTTLMDRSVFSAINVVNGDSIQFTYTITINSET